MPNQFLFKFSRMALAVIFLLMQSCAPAVLALDQKNAIDVPINTPIDSDKIIPDKPTTDPVVNKGHFSPSDESFVSRFLKSSEYIPVSEIKPGMEGYGLTVFQGTKIERFGVKVIGIIRKALNGRDAILVRISGEKLGKNNVVRGMSGSPIYLNGRLCGALSYGFDFSKEPIVGVTPVVDMLDALTFHEDERRNLQHVSLNNKPQYIEVPASSLMLPDAVPVAGGSLRLTPLMAPVSLSGFSSRAQTFLKDKFEDVGLAISSGGTGALDPSLLPKMIGHVHGGESDPLATRVSPGAAVAVMLTTGDFASAATGTATASFGNKIVAFGHAFMEGGSVSLPLATAYILEILPSLSVSFKLSSPLQIIGSIFADRPWSVGAEIGRFATMVPVTISVLDESRGVKKVFQCKVVNHPQLTPDLITASVMSSIDSTYQSQSPYVVKVESDVDIQNHPPIKRVDRFPVNFAPHTNSADAVSRLRFGGDPVSGYIGGIVDRLISNDFERARLNQVKVEVTIEDGRKVTKIDRISLDKSVVAPGDEVKVNCLMRPYNARAYNKQIAFHIPRDVPDCDLAIAVCGGDELDSVRKRMGLSDPTPETLNQIIKKIERRERGDCLCGELALPQQSIALSGQILQSPPAQWTKLFFTDRTTKSPTLVRADQSFREVEDTIVDGCHIIAVSVKRPDRVMSKAMPFMVAASSNRSADGMNITDQARKALDAGRKPDTAIGVTAPAAAATAATAVVVAEQPAAPKVQPMWSLATAFPHMRGIQLWRQDSEENFRGAKLDGVEVDSWGRLVPGFREVARVYPDLAEDQRIWAGVYYKGNFYYSIGNKIYRWAGAVGSVPEFVASAEGLIIPALAIDSARSTLYYASAPGSQVFALNLNSGKTAPIVVAKLSEGTITALAVSESGQLYVGTAGTGRLYRLRQGKAELAFDSGQAHISALWYCQLENRLYVGTAEKGCVYSLSCAESGVADRDRSIKAEFESAEHIVTGVAKDKAGNLYVATAGTGKLIRVKGKGESEVIALSDAFYCLYYDSKDDKIYAGDGEGDISRVEIEPLNGQVYFLPVSHTEQEAVLALACDGQGKLFCGSSNVAQLRSFEIAPSAEPSMCSLVHDAQRRATWSRVRLADIYCADKMFFDRFIKVETRGGDTSQPDLSWSRWTAAAADGDGFVIQSPLSRFLQYKLTWHLGAFNNENGNKRDLIVSRVDVTFLPTNFAPTFSSVSVKSEEAVAGKLPIAIVGADPDADNLQLSLALSADEGKTWDVVAPDVRSGTGESEKGKSKDKGLHKESEKDKTKESKEKALTNKNGDVKLVKETEETKETKPTKQTDESDSSPAGADDKELVKKDKAAGRSKDKSKEKNLSKVKGKVDAPEAVKATENYSQTEKFSYSLDSKKYKDGHYILRFILSDKPSNAYGEEIATVLRSIIIDNSDPEIDSLIVKKVEEGKLSLRLTAHDKFSDISDCLYKIDDGDGFALSPAGTPLSDSTHAVFVGNNVQFAAQAKKLTVQVFNRAGNSAKKTVNLP